MKLLGLIGSNRKDGNSFLLLKEALKDLKIKAEIIQLAQANVQGCDGCGLCREKMECVIEDDVKTIFNKMKEADAVIISTPRYLPIPSKLMALIERIASLHYFTSPFRELNPSLEFPLEGKPFGLMVVSALGGGRALEALKELAYQIIHYWRMKLVTIDSFPYIGVTAKGMEIGEVMKDKKGLENAKKLVKELTT